MALKNIITTVTDRDRVNLEILHPGTYNVVSLLIRNTKDVENLTVMNFSKKELDTLINTLIMVRKDWDNNKEYL
tara:strand:- start:228 stop:449 length:222 start_codon:yes stop_codon:yes gene_type:complete